MNKTRKSFWHQVSMQNIQENEHKHILYWSPTPHEYVILLTVTVCIPRM